jgi:hypothetical protein
MSASSFSHAELFELLARQEEGDALAYGRLCDLLRTNSEARKYYLAQMQLTAHLCWTIGQVDADISRTSQRSATRANTRTVVMAGLTSTWSKLTTPARVLALGIPALLFTYFALLMLSVIWDRAHPSSTDYRLASRHSDERTAATITNEFDARWSADDSARSQRSSVQVAEQLEIDSGIVELKLTQGVNLSVQGPAQWSIDGDNAVSLKQGTLVAQVPGQAVGFTVATPTAKIVDLGTEFGVEVDTTGQTNVQVLKGAVNVDYSSRDGKSKSASRSVRMTAGTAKRFTTQPQNANEVSAVEIAPWLDNTSIQKRNKQQGLSAETRYAAAVLADRPLGYWRFSDTDGHRAEDASGHKHHGEYHGFVSANNPGICPNTSDRSVRFLGKQYGGYVQITDFELPASCTVELWAKSANPRWNSYGWLLSSRAPHGLQITPAEAARSWQVYLNNADFHFAEIGPHQGPSSIDDRFHQYAFSYDAVDDRGTLYCDGMLVHETAKVFGDKPRHEAGRLTMYVGRLAPEYPYESWGEASVDELAIYEGVLPAAAIQRHFEAAEISPTNE